MLTWIEELTRPASERDGEEAVMDFYLGLLSGRIPEVPATASPLLYRRLGYLLELAALRSDPPVADRLSAAGRVARERLDALGVGSASEPAALIGRPRRAAPSGDEVCRRWGLVTGLDLDRFKAYRAARPASDTAGQIQSSSTVLDSDRGQPMSGTHGSM